MNRKMTDEEFQKLSIETEVSVYDLQKLYSAGLLNDGNMLNFLIKHDFNRIRRMDRRYKPAHIIKRLTLHYHVPKQRIISAVYKNGISSYYCTKCGKLIKKSKFLANDGICDDCLSMSIEV